MGFTRRFSVDSAMKIVPVVTAKARHFADQGRAGQSGEKLSPATCSFGLHPASR